MIVVGGGDRLDEERGGAGADERLALHARREGDGIRYLLQHGVAKLQGTGPLLADSKMDSPSA